MAAPSFSAPSKATRKSPGLSLPSRPLLSISPVVSTSNLSTLSTDQHSDEGQQTLKLDGSSRLRSSSVSSESASDENKARVKELRKVISGLTLDDETPPSSGFLRADLASHSPAGPASGASSDSPMSKASSAELPSPLQPVIMTRSSSSSASISSRLGSDGEEELKLSPATLKDLGKIGEGSAGEVRKVLHIPTGTVMAKKTMTTSGNPDIHKQILRELAFNRDCHAPFIVKYYGAFLDDADSQIAICMEWAEGGSLDAVYKQIRRRHGRTGEKVLGKVAEAVLKGLVYLHDRKIIHRDIKPSNILVAKDGQIKLCDFGVSGELINSMAKTFLGTSYYMAPERMRGRPYTWTSDIWSLGLTLYEVAMNRFPFPPEGEAPLGPIDLLHYIERMDAPQLQDDLERGIVYRRLIRDFLRLCLIKDPTQRPNPQDLLQHPWITKSEGRDMDMARWLRQVWDWPEPKA